MWLKAQFTCFRSPARSMLSSSITGSFGKSSLPTSSCFSMICDAICRHTISHYISQSAMQTRRNPVDRGWQSSPVRSHEFTILTTFPIFYAVCMRTTYTPKAVTYHEQPHYCRLMIGHSLGAYGIIIGNVADGSVTSDADETKSPSNPSASIFALVPETRRKGY